jgi:hypothetical protein
LTNSSWAIIPAIKNMKIKKVNNRFIISLLLFWWQ